MFLGSLRPTHKWKFICSRQKLENKSNKRHSTCNVIYHISLHCNTNQTIIKHLLSCLYSIACVCYCCPFCRYYFFRFLSFCAKLGQRTKTTQQEKKTFIYYNWIKAPRPPSINYIGTTGDVDKMKCTKPSTYREWSEDTIQAACITTTCPKDDEHSLCATHYTLHTHTLARSLMPQSQRAQRLSGHKTAGWCPLACPSFVHCWLGHHNTQMIEKHACNNQTHNRTSKANWIEFSAYSSPQQLLFVLPCLMTLVEWFFGHTADEIFHTAAVDQSVEAEEFLWGTSELQEAETKCICMTLACPLKADCACIRRKTNTKSRSEEMQLISVIHTLHFWGPTRLRAQTLAREWHNAMLTSLNRRRVVNITFLALARSLSFRNN